MAGRGQPPQVALFSRVDKVVVAGDQHVTIAQMADERGTAAQAIIDVSFFRTVAMLLTYSPRFFPSRYWASLSRSRTSRIRSLARASPAAMNVARSLSGLPSNWKSW